MAALRGEFVYRLLKPIAKPIFYRKFNVQEGDYCLPPYPEPFILVGYHSAAFDPIIVNAFSKRLIRFLYADANDALWLRSFLLKALDMIPFEKNASDFKSIRSLKKRLEKGQAVGLFPEGGATWDGSTEPLIQSTAKLIKLFQVPVYGIRFNGAYLSKPRWAKSVRRGKVIMNFYELMSWEAIQKSEPDAILNLLRKNLSYNENDWQEQAQVPFYGKERAEYIEKLLYCCPVCLDFNSFISHDEVFTCSHCGSEFLYDLYGFVQSTKKTELAQENIRLSEWNRWQKERLVNALNSDTSLLERSQDYERLRKVIKESPKGLELKDVKLIGFEGKLYFALHGLQMEDRTTGKSTLIPFNRVKSYSITFNSVVEFYFEQKKYHFEFGPQANLSIKLYYDCICFEKEKKQYESELE